MITTAVQQALAAPSPPISKPTVVTQAWPDRLPVRADMDDAISIAGSDSSVLSYVSRQSALVEEEILELELSEDKGLAPDQPPFMGLFPQSLFKSLFLSLSILLSSVLVPSLTVLRLRVP